MYVLIIGAGEVGSDVARILIEEGHEVAVVESDEDLARSLDASMNALVVNGSGLSPGVLKRAGVERADILLAVTSTDEVNLIACMTARKYGKSGLRLLARVRQSQDVAGELALSAADLGLDALISPEQSIADTALDDLRFAGTGEVHELTAGKLVLVGMEMTPDSPLVNETLAELRAGFPGDFVVVGVQGRNARIPSGSDRLEADDRAFVLTRPEYLTELAILSGMPWYLVQHILIVGCGNTGLTLARELEAQNLAPTIIEKDRDRAELVASLLPGSLILHGDGTDTELLKRRIDEGRIDAVLVLLKDPEKSLLIGIFAKSLGARKVIVRNDKGAYAQLANQLGVDAVISPKRAMIDAIQRYVRRGKMELTMMLGEHPVEVLQFRVPEKPERADLLRKPLSELGLPPESMIGAVVRGEEVMIGSDDIVLRPGDELLVVSRRDVLRKVEKLLS